MLAIGVLCSMRATQKTGFSRVLDAVSRTYSIHLEVNDGGVLSTSDYEFVLAPKKPGKDKKPGEYVIRLANLNWSSGTFRKRQATFGGGVIVFEEFGLPPAIIGQGFALAPLLSFYVPGAAALVSTDIPVLFANIGSGWILNGVGRLALASINGQSIDVSGKMTRPNGTQLAFESKALFQLDTGWPISADGQFNNPDLAVKYSIKLKT